MKKLSLYIFPRDNLIDIIIIMKYLRFYAVIAVIILGLSLSNTHDGQPIYDRRLKTDY